jgi:hypothetical protein
MTEIDPHLAFVLLAVAAAVITSVYQAVILPLVLCLLQAWDHLITLRLNANVRAERKHRMDEYRGAMRSELRDAGYGPDAVAIRLLGRWAGGILDDVAWRRDLRRDPRSMRSRVATFAFPPRPATYDRLRYFVTFVQWYVQIAYLAFMAAVGYLFDVSFGDVGLLSPIFGSLFITFVELFRRRRRDAKAAKTHTPSLQ